MVKATLPNGRTERGNANQRHFARQVQRLEGVNVVCSHGIGAVSLALYDEANITKVMLLVSRYDGTAELSSDMSDDSTGAFYSTGAVSLVARF